MWCERCGQDVPAVGSTLSGGLECPRCQHAFENNSEGDEQHAAAHVTLPGEPFHDWESDQRMREIGRSLRTPLGEVPSIGSGTRHWVDSPIVDTPATRQPATSATTREARRQRTADTRTQVVAWLATVFGLGLAAGGVVLLGMGLFGPHGVFWQWGVGVTLAGQAILIGGLIGVLKSLWINSRAASLRLQSVQSELGELQRTADALVGERAAGASTFYEQVARGSSPALLLANLKGQLDHLTTHLHHDV